MSDRLTNSVSLILAKAQAQKYRIVAVSHKMFQNVLKSVGDKVSEEFRDTLAED
ncbi:MAG: hypothetical protein M3N22_03025 [Acidobacteriota bacterium]|nr:hypothetical protein [Acidobacteriota bacterium]